MKKTITIADDVLDKIGQMPHAEVSNLSALVTDTLRDFLDDPDAFKRRRKARLKRADQAAESAGSTSS